MLKRLLTLSLCIFINTAYSADDAGVFETKLDNGLKIIVRQDHRAPVVVSQIWYRVGSANEPGGVTGVSHVLEHMMFKGTDKYPTGTFSRIIAEQGGKENAMTSQDFTMYYQKIASDRLEIAMRLEADRMKNLTLPEKEFTKEIEVVKEERRMRIDDNPMAQTYEMYMAAAHLAHPYHHLPIGWMNDLNNMTNDDLKAYYKKWYAPNNAVLIVIGDVTPAQVVTLAKRYYGDYPKQSLPVLKPQRTPKVLSKRIVEVKLPANIPILYMGYNVPSLKTAADAKEAYALEMLAGVLDSGESARLSKHLVRQQKIVSSAGANYDLLSRFDGLFSLQAIPARGKTIAEVKKALFAEIEKIKKQPVTKPELQRIKTQVIANKVFSKDSLFGQGMMYGQLESVGLDWRVAERYADNIQAVTAAEIQQVAKKSLLPERLTMAVLKPLKKKK